MELGPGPGSAPRHCGVVPARGQCPAVGLCPAVKETQPWLRARPQGPLPTRQNSSSFQPQPCPGTVLAPDQKGEHPPSRPQKAQSKGRCRSSEPFECGRPLSCYSYVRVYWDFNSKAVSRTITGETGGTEGPQEGPQHFLAVSPWAGQSGALRASGRASGPSATRLRALRLTSEETEAQGREVMCPRPHTPEHRDLQDGPQRCSGLLQGMLPRQRTAQAELLRPWGLNHESKQWAQDAVAVAQRQVYLVS